MYTQQLVYLEEKYLRGPGLAKPEVRKWAAPYIYHLEWI